MPDRIGFHCERCNMTYSTNEKVYTGISLLDHKEICLNCVGREINSDQFMNKHLGTIVLSTIQELFVCKRCGNCCTKTTNIVVKQRDIENIAKATRKTKNEVLEKYIKEEDGKFYFKNDRPCVFWEEKRHKCTIYNNKPMICGMFPFASGRPVDKNGQIILSDNAISEDEYRNGGDCNEYMNLVNLVKNNFSGMRGADDKGKVTINGVEHKIPLMPLIIHMAKKKYPGMRMTKVGPMIMDIFMKKYNNLKEGAMINMYLGKDL